MEESNISQIFNADPVTQPPQSLTVFSHRQSQAKHYYLMVRVHTSDAGETSRGQNDQNRYRYLRVMASELSDTRAEQRDLRRIIAKKQSRSAEQNSEGNHNPVFQRHGGNAAFILWNKNVGDIIRRICRDSRPPESRGNDERTDGSLYLEQNP
ncbi:hypothetical protein DAPPUDRAFT_113872 [Daphnia pulex]|uniref:Uncharacterized protein n=1 Tax=Daphnia pulex TaxID=6669 RepID=E9HGC7_DAPPU|nr:hypothetical protein DAPPUDRAFT_113872 [Daphnia pulex]|eukprot:EFX69202.1 hypothetical protein DAPPUDRAFT_113872 [Daphnia pulex]